MAKPNPKNRERRKQNALPLEIRSEKVRNEIVHGLYDYEYSVLEQLRNVLFDVSLNVKVSLEDGLVYHIYNEYDDKMIKQIRDHLDSSSVSYHLDRNGHIEIHIKK